MIAGIELITTNLSVSIDIIIWGVITLSFMLAMNYGYQIGVILQMAAQAILFIWYYNWSEINILIGWWIPLVTFLIFFVLLCFSLYNVSRTSTIN